MGFECIATRVYISSILIYSGKYQCFQLLHFGCPRLNGKRLNLITVLLNYYSLLILTCETNIILKWNIVQFCYEVTIMRRKIEFGWSPCEKKHCYVFWLFLVSNYWLKYHSVLKCWRHIFHFSFDLNFFLQRPRQGNLFISVSTISNYAWIC